MPRIVDIFLAGVVIAFGYKSHNSWVFVGTIIVGGLLVVLALADGYLSKKKGEPNGEKD